MVAGSISQTIKDSPKQISGYERNLHEPKTDVVAKIARLFNIFLDYLVLDERDDLPAVKIGDAFILKNQFKRLVNTPGTHSVSA